MDNPNPFGTVKLPESLSSYGPDADQAIGKVIQYIIWILIIGAGIYSLINFVLAGYSFMSAGDDPKKIASAWAMIWQTAIGLAFAAGSIVLAALFGQLIFRDPMFILKPTIPLL
jgi:hypothetical protein